MHKPKALFILNDCDLIYSPSQQVEINRLLDIVAAPQTRARIQDEISLLRDVEIILSGWGAPQMDTAFLEAAPKLKAVFYGAGSIKKFVTDEFWERGIRLTSAYAANAVPVADYTLGVILLSLKRFWHFAQRVQAERTFTPHGERVFPGTYGSIIGLVSLGAIGRLVAERLQPFDLKVIAYDPFVSIEEGAHLGVEMVALERIFTESDVVSLHSPLLPETKGLITGKLLKAMKPNSTFINTSRGAIVRENELIEVLRKRSDLYAVLDITYPEPPAPESPLYTLPNVLLTPHISGSLSNECHRMGQYMVEELKRYLTGEPLQWEITREKARRMA